MSSIHEYGEVVCFIILKPFLCGCSDRLRNWAYYQEAIQQERLFKDIQWPNNEWVKPKDGTGKHCYVVNDL